MAKRKMRIIDLWPIASNKKETERNDNVPLLGWEALGVGHDRVLADLRNFCRPVGATG